MRVLFATLLAALALSATAALADDTTSLNVPAVSGAVDTGLGYVEAGVSYAYYGIGDIFEALDRVLDHDDLFDRF